MACGASSVCTGIVVALGVSLVSTTVLAQEGSLADLAKQERARRASITDKAKVYTNDDLRGGPRLTTGTPPPTPTETGIDPDPPELSTSPADTLVTPTSDTPDSQDIEQDEDYWRSRIMTARDARQRAELMAAALQNRVDGLWAAFTARDDPFQRAEIEQDRIEALQELDNTQAELERLDQEIRDIQEEARRASVPPGWLR